MPEAGLPRPEVAVPPVRQERWVSPMLRRILLVNALPLLLLVVTLLYLDQYQNGLIEAEVSALRTQAQIYAGALSEAAVRDDTPDRPTLLPERARPLMLGLTVPTPNAQARVFDTSGQLVTDSRVREGPGGAVITEPLPPPVERSTVMGAISRAYDIALGVLPHPATPHIESVSGNGLDWQPDLRDGIRVTPNGPGRDVPPFIRRTEEGRLLVSVAVPVMRNRVQAGVILLTSEAREVDNSLFQVRVSIMSLFMLALVLTLVLSFYLSRTLARPMIRLAAAADSMREGKGRAGHVPADLTSRSDEVGELAVALDISAHALWARMDAIERFAADVAHEIKNPLTSIRSAIETSRRIENPDQQKKLLAIIGEDVVRLDRLISDISDASRVDAELSRATTERVDIAPMLATLADIHQSTRDAGAPVIVVDAPESGLVVAGVEGRLVQVLRNLIGNAASFSPLNGQITLHARETGAVVEVAVEDEGPGIPDHRLEEVFDRFYSERPRSEHFGKHSGLGLSICRQIVEALSGRISAENRRDDTGRILGARFVVRLPKAG